MEQRKKRVGIVTSSLLLKTGFSQHARALIPFLYNKDKYEIFHLNQGIGQDFHLSRFPWANEGALQDGTFDGQRFQTDDAYRRWCSYGNSIIERFVLNNKLDCVIHIEDGWSSDVAAWLDSKWYPYLKDNVLNHTTADSLPILPIFKVWAERCPNIWFWTSFAEKALKNEDSVKYGHVKTIHGCLSAKDYKPALIFEKEILKQKFGIDKDTIIFLQLGRNQLRKLYPATLEAFARYKKDNPKHKSKLFFHCSWVDQGWPLEKMVKDNGLAREDVLTTYFCRNCGAWEIKPYEGEDKDCKYCGAKGQAGNPGSGQITAGVTSTISNRDMQQIYGIADAVVNPITSGGLEYANVEALLCGKPLLTSNYSCGEDFCDQDFVFRLDGNFTFEVGTGFKKHVPNINTITKFFKKIYEMPVEERKAIGNKGREWALNTFDISVIGPKYEEWIDSRALINWDYKYPIPEPKDPNAEVMDNPDPILFLKGAYSKILKMEVTNEDAGLKYWENELKKGAPKESIVNFFRNEAAKENQKNQKQPTIEDLLENTGRKKFLIVMKESIGDLLYLTALLKSFRENYKDWDIYLATEPQYFCIFEGNEYITKCIPFSPCMDSEVAMTGQGGNKGLFDGYCGVGVMTQKHLNYLTNNNTNLQLS